jgi:hypothetical protein
MKDALSSAVLAILRSLIALMYRRGISFGEFTQLAKVAYTKEVEQELIKANEKVTTSRIAIITGLTRKEVAAIRKQKTIKIEHTQKHGRAIRVLTAWASNASFNDKKGQALILDVQGEGISFESLVSQFSGDMPYRAMLNELIRTGSVELIDKNKVKLLRVAHIPTNQDDNEKYTILGEDVPLLISSIKHNIINTDESPFYQRKVCYNDISRKHIAEFKALANHENQALLERLNNWLAEHDAERPDSNSSVKVGVGVYYFEEQQSSVEGI